MPNHRFTLLSLGEILWDILPEGKLLGGAPANVAWHAHQLGIDAHVASAVGDDELGHAIQARLDAMKLGYEHVQVLSGKTTGTVDACLDASGNASYVIHEDVAWDHLSVSPAVTAMASRVDAIAYGSLAQRSPVAGTAIRAILDAAHPGTLRVFDINLRPPHFSRESLCAGMERATVLKLNHEELPVITRLFNLPSSRDRALSELRHRYPALRSVVVTCGSDGAVWHDDDGSLHLRSTAAIEVADTVGAGDSFTAAVIIGLLKQWDTKRIVRSALEVASFVCTRHGATPVLPPALTKLFAE